MEEPIVKNNAGGCSMDNSIIKNIPGVSGANTDNSIDCIQQYCTVQFKDANRDPVISNIMDQNMLSSTSMRKILKDVQDLQSRYEMLQKTFKDTSARLDVCNHDKTVCISETDALASYSNSINKSYTDCVNTRASYYSSWQNCIANPKCNPCAVCPKLPLAIDQGAFNTAPWYSSFSDQKARWIWNTPGATSSASGGIYVQFQITYTNTTNSKIQATLFFCCDNATFIYQNNSQIAPLTWPPSWTGSSMSVTLAVGENKFQFIGLNAGGPAGLIFSLKDSSGNVLMRSDNSTSAPLPNSTKTIVVAASTSQALVIA
jgi:hypothetical protein